MRNSRPFIGPPFLTLFVSIAAVESEVEAHSASFADAQKEVCDILHRLCCADDYAM